MGTPMKTKRPGKLPGLCFSSERRFGAELEINSFDGKSRPESGQKPAGIDTVAMLVARNCSEGVDIRDWEHTSGNDVWVIKPDSSCGMEVCTPILKGWHGVKKVVDVVKAFADEPQIKVDNRTSIHVHAEVADLSQEQLATVIAYWFKCEPVFMDSVPLHRKRNRYCQYMGYNTLLQHDTKISPQDLIRKVGNVKYYSLNTNQMMRHGRKTIEFRIVEGDGCKDPFLVKNWIRLLMHFIDMAARREWPADFKEGDPWSSFLWLDPEDVFRLLGFSNNPHEYELSPGLRQVRNWLLARLARHMSKDIDTGCRQFAYRELQQMLARYKEEGDEITEAYLTPSDVKDALYSEETKI